MNGSIFNSKGVHVGVVTGDAVCTVCGAALESWWTSTHIPSSNLSNVQIEGRQPRRTLLTKVDHAPNQILGVQSAQAKKAATVAER